MGVFDVVFTSSVRQTVLGQLSDRPRQRRDLLDDVDASKSAVYNALNELRDRDLVREGQSRRWETTGLGDLVADYVAQRERAGDVLSTQAAYWTTYDAGALPDPFRESLGSLAGCERLSSPEAEPFRAVSEVVDVIEGAETVSIVAPMYHDRYAAALECAAVDADVRLVLGQSVLRNVAEREDADWDEDNPEVRIGTPAFTLVVTESTLVLALPREGGTFDIEGKLVANGDRALEWGERLFEHVWRESTPLAAFEAEAQAPQ